MLVVNGDVTQISSSFDSAYRINRTVSAITMFQQLSGLQPRHHVPSLNTETNKSQTDSNSNTGEEARSHGTGRKNPPVNLPALVPTPYRNSLRGWVSIHFAHQLANIFPREQIRHESYAEEN
jgi:hypothetical protein